MDSGRQYGVGDGNPRSEGWQQDKDLGVIMERPLPIAKLQANLGSFYFKRGDL